VARSTDGAEHDQARNQVDSSAAFLAAGLAKNDSEDQEKEESKVSHDASEATKSVEPKDNGSKFLIDQDQIDLAAEEGADGEGAEGDEENNKQETGVGKTDSAITSAALALALESKSDDEKD